MESVDIKDRKRLILSDFRGVDASSPVYNVDTKRASAMLNLISIDGNNHKRNGWKQFCGTFDGKINGYFDFTIGGHHINLVYVSNLQHSGKFYIKKENGEYQNLKDYIENAGGTYAVGEYLKDNKCSMYLQNDRAYFFGIGNVLCLGYVENVLHMDYNVAYVPETTTNIECEELEYDENDLLIKKVGRQTLESPNALTPKRTNLIIGAYHNSYEDNEGRTQYRKRTYKLDSDSVSYGIASIVLKIVTGELDADGNIVEFERVYRNYENNNNNTIGYFKSGSESTYKVATIDYNTGILTFDGAGTNTHTNCKPVYDGIPNITITYYSAETEMAVSLDKITNCTISTLFGVNGESNVVFLSGNRYYPHCDWWSKTGDFTYFPTENECLVGSASSEIVGYQRLGDDSLAILKSENYNEPTLYIRTGVAASYTEDGDVSKGYYITAGKYIVTGAISSDSFGMLAGDSLFLSRNGVYAISIQGDTISISERVAKERSRLIDSLLKEYTLPQLMKAKAIVHNNRYYLAINGDVYVADARFKFTTKGDMGDTFNYEWWVWDNCPVHYWFEDEESNLCFGTEDGRLCKFDNAYQDRIINLATTAIITESSPASYITFSGITLQSGSQIILKGKRNNIPKQYIVNSNQMVIDTDENKIRVVNSCGEKLRNGMEIYVGGTTGLDTTKKYFIKNLIKSEVDATYKWEFEIYYNEFLQDEIIVDLSEETRFDILKSIDGEIIQVKRLQAYGSYYLYSLDSDPLKVQNMNDGHFSLIEYIPKNVVAKWFTPALDMNANDYIKTLCGLTIATEQITNGRIKFGFETKGANSLTEIDAKGLDIFDFSNLNFDKFTFDTGFTTSFSKKVKANFNFIIFKFESDNEFDACVYNLTLSYKINRKNKGVF